MHKFLATFFCLICCASYNPLKAQYFQQTIAYDISASQDTSNHTIDGICNINYTNNAPEKLDTIFLHLWANAFSDNMEMRPSPLFFWSFDTKQAFDENARPYIDPALQEGTTPLAKIMNGKNTHGPV